MINIFTKFSIISMWLFISSILLAQSEEINYNKVFCYRTIEKQLNDFTITLIINTANLEKDKTLKIKEKFPEGFTCNIKDGYGSTNAIANNTILFVWAVLPSSNLFKITYTLSSAVPINESIVITGNLSYFSETGIKYVSISNIDLANYPELKEKIKSIPSYQPGAQTSATSNTSTSLITMTEIPKTQTPARSQDTVIPKPKPRTNIKEETSKTAPQPAISSQPKSTEQNQPTTIKENIEAKTNEKSNVTELPPANITNTAKNNTSTISGFYYTVQIGASLKPLPKDYFNKYQFNQPVDELFIDNMYKYSVGKFNTLKEANNYQKYVQQKGLQCFVVAYQNGKKITIKEALSISKQ